jgi:glycerol uptake facilitator-like aquaporin
MAASLSKRITAEFLGTTLLLAAVVGSGIMGERLAGGNVAIALLVNAIATGGALVALILTFAPISGAHFNPLVTLAIARGDGLDRRVVPAYILAQLTGALAGVFLAHAMFGLSIIEASTHSRASFGEQLSEVVATFGLIGVILSCSRYTPTMTPFVVAAYITGAYWFTASTSFANPAVAFARAFTNSFAGIRLIDVGGFVIAECLGAAAAVGLFGWLMAGERA